MNFMDFTPEQQKEYDAWVASKPLVIQDMVLPLPS